MRLFAKVLILGSINVTTSVSMKLLPHYSNGRYIYYRAC
jgi:hypothetical protein